MNNILFNKQKLLRRLQDNDHPTYLNLGSGPRGLSDPRWINIDGYTDTNVHYLADFTRRWPLPDDSLDGIFCEHVLEHFELEVGEHVLRECLRVLRPRGCIRVIVPDGEKIMRTYFEDASALLQNRACETNCAIEAVNSYFRQRYEHQCMYDWKLLEYQFSKVGFTGVRRANFKEATVSDPIMLDDKKYAWESLYVEAIKPSVSPENISSTSN